MAILPDHLPHTFLVVTDSDGVSRAWGFAPEKTGFWGNGAVTRNDDHGWQSTTGQFEISEQSYEKLTSLIERDHINPPYYNLLAGIQCATWVSMVLNEAGIIDSLNSPQPINGYYSIFHTLVWNPYMQALGDFIYQELPRLLTASGAVTSLTYQQVINTAFLSSKTATPLRVDPLILDLDNDGLETIGINTSNPILFDHNGNGVRTATGWVKSDDAFLPSSTVRRQKQRFSGGIPRNHAGCRPFSVKVV